MVKADATPKTWMEFVKEVRDKNPGMALKDILRLASKLRGKSSSGNSGKSSSGNSGKSQKQKQKKRGGMLSPILGGAPGDDIKYPAAPAVAEGQVAAEEGQVAAAGQVAGPVAAAAAAPVAAEKLPSIPEDSEVTGGRGRKSKKRSKKSKKSRKSKSKKSKRRH